MRTTATSSIVAVVAHDGAKRVVVDPSPRDLETALSTHALVFTALDELLMVESEGDFTVDDWDQVYEAARKVCCQSDVKAGIDMITDEDDSGSNMSHFVRSTLETRVAADLHWK